MAEAERGGHVSAVGDGSELSAHLSEVEERLAAAVAASDRLRARLAEGRPGNADDVARFTEFANALEAAAALSGGDVPVSVDDLRALVERVEDEDRQREERLVSAVEAVARLEDGRGAAVKACKEMARASMQSGALDDPDARQRAEGLLALIELDRSPEGDDREDLERAAVEALPQECIPAVGLAQMGILEHPGRPSPRVEESKEAEEQVAADAEAEPAVDAAEAERKDTSVEMSSSAEEEPQEDDALEEAQPPPPPSADDVDAALKRLLREGRFGFAHWVVLASDGSPGLRKALAALAYAGAMRSPVGESAGRLRDLVGDLSPEELRGDDVARLIVLVAGLRATLLAPHSGAVALLDAVATSFSKPPGLERFVHAVTDAGRRGLLATGVTMHARNIATTEDDLSAVQARAREMLKARTIKYQRASNVWRNWIAEDGLLGALLSDVVAGRVERLDDVERAVFDLRSAKVLEKELDATDRTLRAAGRKKPITDKARSKLIEGAEEALGIAADWADVSRRLERARQAEDSAAWAKGLLENLRSVAFEAREEIGAIWEKWSQGSSMVAAAAAGTRPIVDDVFGLVVEGKSPEGPEQQVDEILGLELLRVEGLEIDDRLVPVTPPPTAPLLRAVDAGDWEAAFHQRLKEARFRTAARIVEVLRRNSPDEADRLEDLRLEQLEEERRHLNGRLDEVARALESARRQGRLLESDALTLSNDLNQLELDDDGEELAGADEAISALQEKLEEAECRGRERALDKFKPRLAEDPKLQPHRERFERLLEAGEISTLEELVLAVERGNEPPSEPAALLHQLTSFFPGVADDPVLTKLPAPAELAKLVRDRGSLGTVSFENLRDEEMETVEAALMAWGRIAGKDLREVNADLELVLDFLGLTVEQELDLKVSAREQRSHLVYAQPFGEALAPAFGSAAKGRYRILPAWGKTTDDALVGTISQVAGKEPIVVLSLGTVLKPETRRGIADQLRHSKTSRPVALIDNAAFVYLAAQGGRNLARTMRIALPFTALNPYTPFVAGNVPLEMFYGRHEELAEVIDPIGTSFIYGGRRLGKSALLRAAVREVEAEAGEHRAIYVDLKSNGIGEWRAAEEIVAVIVKALIDAGVMTSTAAKSESEGFDLVRDQVSAWLDRTDRRILLLLDECDSFLNADAENGFRNVSQLKGLMEETGRMFKPVFAGLHQVNRFQRMPNQPLAHLGPQLPVGPLTPQRAYELITKPMEALGYRFEPDGGLPERILTATNYQPSLIQLFCSELVKHMLERHARGLGTPPYTVTSEDVEHVYQTPHVVEEMRSRFELTINLDPRYRVIAYVIALEARERGLSVGLDPQEIKAACEEYWPAGFAETSADEFRTLLEEMDSLGVLFKRDSTFLMRSPNVLRMLGTSEQIEERLFDAADELEIEQGFEATTFRDAMGGDAYRRRPLTHQQVAGMIERQQRRVHVVVGSRATGVDDVHSCLKELFEGDAGKYNFIDATGETARRLAGRFRKPATKKHRVVHYRMQPDDGMDVIHAVEDKIARGAGPSTAIFVVGGDTMSTWRAAVAPREDGRSVEAGDGLPRFEVVELRRWTEAGLRAWTQAQEVDLPFHEKQALKEVMRATGGWPLLVGDVVKSYRSNRNWPQAIEELESRLNDREEARLLCEAIALTADSPARDAWKSLVGWGEPVEWEEFQELIDGDPDEAAATSMLLRSMQVIDFDEGGRFMAEPTAARAWQTMAADQPDAGS